jgi:hypothetical protein
MPTNAVAPAAIQINLTRHMPQEELSERGWLDSGGNRVNRPDPEWKTIEQRAATTVWAAVAPGLEGLAACTSTTALLPGRGVATRRVPEKSRPFGPGGVPGQPGPPDCRVRVPVNNSAPFEH